MKSINKVDRRCSKVDKVVNLMVLSFWASYFSLVTFFIFIVLGVVL